MENNFYKSHSYTEKINDCYNTADNNELDVANYWTNRTVREEVLRGVHLRKTKNIKSSEHIKEYDILNLQLPKQSLCGDNRLYTSAIHRRRHLSQANTSPGSPRSTSPSLRKNSPCDKIIRCALSPKSSHKCSMRIAALAQPAKRQCIDTWRNNFDVLPGFMIDRLKQQVLDEKPLVHIPQAIKCFKKRQLPWTDYRSSKKLNPSEIQKNRRMEEIKKLCALFGKKIAQRLKTPAVEMDLNSHLKSISRIVTLEISTLLKSQNKINMDSNGNKRMLDEVSRKVTLWIATVLEDSSYKQLEDDLRVPKTINKIMPRRKSFELITLIQKILNQEMESNTAELEEEEGPVLDIIDNMLDKVFNICETQINNQNEVKEQKSNITLDTTENNQFDMSTTAQTYTSEYDTGESDMTIDKSIERDSLLQKRESFHESETPQHSGTQVFVNILDNILTDAAMTDNIKEDLRNDIKNLIDNFESDTNSKHEDVSTDQLTDVKNHIREDDIEHILNPRDRDTNLNIDNNLQQNVAEYLTDTKSDIIDINDDIIDVNDDIIDVNENIIDVSEDIIEVNDDIIDVNDDIIDVNDTSKEEQLLENDLDSNHLDETNSRRMESIKIEDQHLDEKDQNIYEADAETIEDLIFDEQYKKVKFSTTDIDLQLKSSSNTTSPNAKNVGDDNRQSTDHIKPAHLSAPNKNLLSIVDESWPEDVEMSPVKALQNVSKSVMSLGNILEAQESKPTSPTDDDIKQSAKEMLNMLNERIAKSEADYLKNEHEYLDTIPILYKRNSDKIINQLTESMSKEEADVKYMEFKNTADMVEEHTVLVTDIDRTTSSECKITEAENKISRQLHSSKAKHSFGDRLNVGTGDQKDTKNKNNVIYDAVIRKLNQSNVKFDYRVRPSTAPSWVARGHGEPSEDSHHNHEIRTTHKRKECNIRQWCKNMENIVETVDMWNKWIDYTCKSVILNKERKNKITSDSSKKVTTDWVNLKRDIDMDADFWEKFRRRAVKSVKYGLKAKESILREDKKTIAKSQLLSKEIVERIEDIEKIFSWMHRLMVSTEYSLRCNCKKYLHKTP